jgi:hypothetical protein
MDPKPTLRASEYIYKAADLPNVIRVDQLANGGPVEPVNLTPLFRNTPCLPCPHCAKPEGWDACPIHRDGAPPTPPPHAQG